MFKIITKLKKRSSFKLRSKTSILIIFVLFVGVVLRLSLVLKPFNEIIPYFADDAFYYFQVARNFAEGKGVVFNNGITTNGFHPLYFILLVPIFFIFGPINQNLPIYVILLMLSIFDIGTGVVLYKIGVKVLNNNAGILACTFWLLNPFIFYITYLGLETSIQIFFISCLTFLILKNNTSKFSFKKSCYIVLLLILIIYSRLDGIFMYLGVLISLIIQRLNFLKKNTSYRKFHQRFLQIFKCKDLLFISIIPLFSVFIWILWSYVNVGIFYPISAHNVDVAYMNRYLFYIAKAVENTLGFIINLIFLPTGMIIIQLLVAFIFYGIPLIYFLYKWIFKKDHTLKNLVQTFDFLIFTSFFFFFYYWFVMSKVKPWYAQFVNLITILFYSSMLIHITEDLKRSSHKKKFTGRIQKNSPKLMFVIFLFIFFFNGVESRNQRYGSLHHTEAMLEAARYLDENISKEEKIGAFNAGLIQYHTDKHDIINLDGVINPEAFFARQNGTIDDYIIKKNITYIIDPISSVENNLKNSKLLFISVKEFQTDYHLFKIYVV